MSVIHGDCIEVMRAMPEASVDAVVTDPPYGLEFMGKEWDSLGKSGVQKKADVGGGDKRAVVDADKWGGADGVSSPFSRSRIRWQHGTAGPAAMQEWHQAWAIEALRVLKPGGHLLAFGGTRTFHRLACAVEDAGFEIRDCLSWLYGSGFPKSHNVALSIDKKFGGEDRGRAIPAASTQAEAWEGWGTALKPGWEPIIMARKPLIGTVAKNVLEHRTGPLNIDATRVGTTKDTPASPRRAAQGPAYGDLSKDPATGSGWDKNTGRWPANVTLSHSEDCVRVGEREVSGGTAKQPDGKQMERSIYGATGTLGRELTYASEGKETIEAWDCTPDCPVRMLDEQTGERKAGGDVKTSEQGFAQDSYMGGGAGTGTYASYADKGGASRFFYTSKASKKERNAGLDDFEKKPRRGDAKNSTPRSEQIYESKGALGAPRANHHPTVKPLKLMQWLCKLVTPPEGIILDPFLGSGTTGCAAVMEDFQIIGIEKDAEYIKIAEARIDWWAQNEH